MADNVNKFKACLLHLHAHYSQLRNGVLNQGLDFGKPALSIGHCKLNEMSLMKLNLGFKFIMYYVCLLFYFIYFSIIQPFILSFKQS